MIILFLALVAPLAVIIWLALLVSYYRAQHHKAWYEYQQSIDYLASIREYRAEMDDYFKDNS